MTPNSAVRKMRPREGDPTRTPAARSRDLTRAATRDLKTDTRSPGDFSYAGYFIARSRATTAWLVSWNGTPIGEAPTATEARRLVDNRTAQEAR